MEHYQKTSKINKFAKKQAVALWGTMGHYQKTPKINNFAKNKLWHYGALWGTMEHYHKTQKFNKNIKNTKFANFAKTIKKIFASFAKNADIAKICPKEHLPKNIEKNKNAIFAKASTSFDIYIYSN
jgi:predicted NAD-dependent protein-ADP-ribosyltransferase YbiA (DUF1768 family)